jgi:outer membrane protein OmpA-like peptidoglycan-associated protein
MKKILLFSLLVLFGMTGNLSAQEKTDAEVSHWSVAAKAGLDFFRVNPMASGQGTIRNLLSQISPMGSLSIEYTFNPLFGIGAEGSFLSFGRNTAAGKTLDATAYASVNLTNLLWKERAGFWNRLNFYTNLGAGLQYSTYSLYVAPNTSGRGISAVLPTILLLELRLSRSLTLGAEAQYRYYTNEQLGGLPVNGLNSDALVAAGSIRYKLGAGGDKTHVRNMTVSEFYPAPVPVIIEKVVEKAVISDAELNRFKALEEKNAQLEAKLNEIKTASSIIDEKTTTNAAELKRVKAVEEMNAMLLTEVGKIKNLEASNAQLQQELKKLQSVQVVVQGDDALTSKLQSLEEKNAAMELEQANLRDQIAQMKAATPKEAVKEVVKEVVKVETPETKVIQEVTVKEVIPAEDLKRIKSLEDSNEQLKAQIECLKKAIESAKAADKSALVEENAKMLKALEAKNAQLEADIEKLKSVLAEMKEKEEAAAKEKAEKAAVKAEAAKAAAAKEEAIDTKALTASVKFKFNSNDLDPASFDTLDKLAAILKAAPALKLGITGHTDNIGAATVNQKLSEVRANVVKEYLVKKGVNAANITATGLGATKPIDTNDTAEGRANNRRVEFAIGK